MLHHTRTLGVTQADEPVWKKLAREERPEVEQVFDETLDPYYGRLNQ